MHLDYLMKGKKIVSILSNFVEIKKCNVLDIGTAGGFLAHHLSQFFPCCLESLCPGYILVLEKI